MRRTIKEERDRIISLLGIREQEESYKSNSFKS